MPDLYKVLGYSYEQIKQWACMVDRKADIQM